MEIVGWDPVQPGGAVPVILKLRDEMGRLLSHTSPIITVVNPNGSEVVQAVAMELDPALNQSTYVYQTSDTYTEGTYLVKASCTRTIDGDPYIFRAKAKFRLRETLD